MRNTVRAKVAIFLVFGAVAVSVGSGGEQPKTEQSNSQADEDESGAVARPAATTTGTATNAPATGKTIDVKMVGDVSGYRFVPTTVAVHTGDQVRWTVVSGPPHNVSFWPDSIPTGAAAQLSANMPRTTQPLTGPFVNTPNETYVVSFANVPAGTYHYYCIPHLALGMKAVIKVR